MNFYLGIDGGGTKTTCVVGDDARLLGTGESGGSSISRSGPACVQAALHEAISQACALAGIAPGSISSTCIGVTGASNPEVREAVQGIISGIVSGPVVVLGDHEIAWEAAFAGGAGVIVASGTGSIAYGRNERGASARAGGNGPASSDEGSGHWIGRMAMSEGLCINEFARDRAGSATPAFGAGQAADETAALQPAALQQTAEPEDAPAVQDYASLFPQVLRAAEGGNPVAINILQRAGVELALLATTVIDQLWDRNASVSVTLVGGVFAYSAMIRYEFTASLAESHRRAEICLAKADPVMGALSMARRSLQRSSP